MKAITKMLIVILGMVSCTNTEQPTADLVDIKLVPESVVVSENDTVTFRTIGRFRNNSELDVAASYSIDGGGTINQNGIYVANDEFGNFEATAISLDNNNLSSKARIRNRGKLKIVELLPDSVTLEQGQQVQFTSFGIMANKDTVNIATEYLATGGTITVDGLYTAGQTDGEYIVVATFNSLSDTSIVTIGTVVPPPPPPPITVESVTIVPDVTSVDVGNTVQLQAVVRGSDGSILTDRVVTWSSNDALIATVNNSGLVNGVSAGTTTITATCEGKTGNSTVTVNDVIPPPPPPPPPGECGAWPSIVYQRMPESTGQAFYVSSSNGNDSNSGSIDSPWRTLQKAFNTLQPGQIAYLREGTYGEFCTSSEFSRAGTPSEIITVSGYPGERAVLHGQIRLRGSYFRLTNVVVEGPSCGVWGASTRQGENLVLMSPGVTHHTEVSNSEVFHSGWHAGISAGGDDIWILNNYIHDNGGFNDPDQYNTSHGIYYHDGTRGVVANNIIEHNRAKGISARYSANNILIINNTVVGNGRSGIDITENTHDWTFVNNIIMNNGNYNGGVGIHTSGSSGGSSNVHINNVYWNNGTSGNSHWDSNATIIEPLVADPLLVNPMTSVVTDSHQGYSNDYHLRDGSPAIDYADTRYALPFDIDGVCRPMGSGPDAGAYER